MSILNANILFEKQKNSKRILRWKYLFNEHDLVFKHIDGVKNNAADFLSRIYSTHSHQDIYNYNLIKHLQNHHQSQIQQYLYKQVLLGNTKIWVNAKNQIILPYQAIKPIFERIPRNA